MRISRRLLATAAGLAVATLAVGPADASHSWGGYHWAWTNNAAQFNLNLGDNVSSAWDAYLGEASRDWSLSGVLDTTVVSGRTTAKKCGMVSGRVEVCSAAYGARGWLGLATISIAGSHITAGTVKLNDTYYATGSSYDTPAWRRFVMCQEIGHTFGLGHVNEAFNDPNTGSCMDYTNDPSGTKGTNGTLSNEHPNSHDFTMLEQIYNHADNSTNLTGSTGQQAAAAGAGNGQGEWGQAVRYSEDGRPILFVQDLGNGHRIFTFVVWAL